MKTEEKHVFYRATNTYSTLNAFSEQTKNVWMVFHGMGFLSRYFLTHFRTLSSNENYLIAPQAPSKYYQRSNFKYVGASWLTKENTVEETENVLRYMDAVYAEEGPFPSKRLIFFGFSQGVSICLRWLVSRKIKPDLLVLYAGGLPKELVPSDCAFLAGVPIKIIYADQDQFLTPDRLKQERIRTEQLFNRAKVETLFFHGKHEIKEEVIEQLLSKE